MSDIEEKSNNAVKALKGNFIKVQQVFTALQVSYFYFTIRNNLYHGKCKTTEDGKQILFQLSYFYSSSFIILAFVAEKISDINTVFCLEVIKKLFQQ